MESWRAARQDRRIDFLVGRNWVLTVHNEEVAYLQGFRAQDNADTETGALTAAALSASLLDWHLEEYFAEVSRIEGAIDDLDERILSAPSEQRLLEEILAVRRRSSRLRRTLMAQRAIFYGLSRPDLGQVVDSHAVDAFAPWRAGSSAPWRRRSLRAISVSAVSSSSRRARPNRPTISSRRSPSSRSSSGQRRLSQGSSE